MASMATILIKFQQKLLKFSAMHHHISEQKRLLAHLKSASNVFLSWRVECDVFLLKLRSAIARSYVARKNDYTDLQG